MVRLDCGPSVIAHLDARLRPGAVAASACRPSLDRAGQAALVAMPEKDTPHMTDDAKLREMTCDPKFRKVLVTDAKTRSARPGAGCAEAGADLIWAGHAEPWKKSPGFERLSSIPQVSLVPLDLTDPARSRTLAAEIGFKRRHPDQHRRPPPHLRHRGAPGRRHRARRDGHELLRTAAAGAGVRAGRCVRGARTGSPARSPGSICCRSIALSNFPPHGTYSASKAAALSLSPSACAPSSPGRRPRHQRVSRTDRR